MPAAKRQRTPAAARKRSQRQTDLERKRDETISHLENIAREEQALRERAAELDAARQQMMGRLRLIQEDLGEVPPLASPPPAPNGSAPVAEGGPEGPGEE